VPHRRGGLDLARPRANPQEADVQPGEPGRFFFPRWSNRVVPNALAVLVGIVTLGAAAFAYYGTDANLAVGYAPVQPVEYSHKLHAGDLGLDCRYCHSTVERSPFAAVPPTQTCMNCHSKVRADSVKLLAVRESFAEQRPIRWAHVYRLPDYVYFDHSAHLSAGVGCSTCHGRIDQMPRVTQAQPLSMGWCLDCHRNPGPNLRDPSEITKMDWVPREASALSAKPMVGTRVIDPPTHCSGCHR
jgi:hypothetical protein